MKIAILSGKGGTGKTLVSVNLASVSDNSCYIDCDVEEPNGHLFFKPKNIKRTKISVKIPRVDDDMCNGCRSCVNFCRFNALAFLSGKIRVFPNICHSCGGCEYICKQGAITETNKEIGGIHYGISDNVHVYSGILNIGESSGVPIIKELLEFDYNDYDTFIDCPPGSACTVMESIKDVDYCVIVVEPTLFGLHNMRDRKSVV